MMQRTYQTRLSGDPDRDQILDAYADLYGRAERALFARLRAGEPLAALKREFLIRFGLTARQFNALAADLQGKISSVRKRRPGLIRSLERRIARARKVLRKVPRGGDTYHQKRRRLARLEQRLRALQADQGAGRMRLCLGSRRLFRQQFALSANGYASHQDWLLAWRASRSNQFFVLGSKDETAGCQGCVASFQEDVSVTLRLRLPNALAAYGKFLEIPRLRFAYGHDAVVAALGRNLSPDQHEHEAISWRFVRDHRGWRVLATVSVPPGEPRSVRGIGVIAVDLNADHLAVAELDRCGNVIASFRVPCVTHGKSRHQRVAVIGDAVKQVIAYACAAFHAILQARAYDAGVKVQQVNPAYTSVIGAYKFARRFGLSRHHAAALCIGRRGMRLAERPNRRMDDHVAFPLPVRNRGKHVWSFWRQVARRAAAHRARGRPGEVARSWPVPTPGIRGTARRAIRSSVAGGMPARESSATLFGLRLWVCPECPRN